MSESTEKKLAYKLFPKQDEDHSDSILNIPPEQRRLHTETYDFSIATVIDHLKDGHIFVPEFQRRYVWSQSQASRLIESLIIQCPIPVVYLSQEHDEKLSVIDGNQRLNSIKDFVENKFELRGLTAYPELENFRFFELDPRFQRHITNRTIRCIVIMKDTHPQVKFDVFERLNSGAVKLTAQELRHGLYFGKLMKLAAKLAKDKKWQELFGLPPNKRMRLEEFALRFLALDKDFSNYKKPLSSFLNDFTASYRNITDDEVNLITAHFQKMVKGVHDVYGDKAFKVFSADGTIRSHFNAALFDAEVLSISKSIKTVRPLSDKEKKALYRKLAEVFEEDAFQKTITRATSDEAALKLRVQKIDSIIQGCL